MVTVFSPLLAAILDDAVLDSSGQMVDYFTVKINKKGSGPEILCPLNFYRSFDRP